MRKTPILIIIILLTVAGYSCRQQVNTPDTVTRTVSIEQAYSEKGSIKEMSITPLAASFPDYDGKAEFMSYCAICHSLKYISMQPAFPEKVWSEEVHKMIEKYGAPIDSVTSKKIVAYLTHIKSPIQAGN
jgi:hypothetical protein